MADLTNKVEWLRGLIIGLVVTLASTTSQSWLAKIPLIGGIISFNAIIGSSIVVGLLAVLTMVLMDKVDALKV